VCFVGEISVGFQAWSKNTQGPGSIANTRAPFIVAYLGATRLSTTGKMSI